VARARAEQAIEDYNSLQRCEGSLHRRFICLPLTDHFDPPPGQQGHGKLQVHIAGVGARGKDPVSSTLILVVRACQRRACC